jgi:geranylgeranyl reductase family protein
MAVTEGGGHCDVLIVGGGPAGSTCAARLRAAGLDVMVMDRRPFPRDKVCAGWITPAVVETLALDLEDYGRERVLQPITGFITGMEGRRPVSVAYDRPVSYGIRRCEFDHYLLRRSGARLWLGESLETMERRGERWLINERIEAGLVIGAGGHFCPVARHLGARPGRGELAVTAQEIEVRLDERELGACRVAPEVPELYFCADMKGYGWCFRKGDWLNVGLGREGGHQLSRHVAAFRARLIAEGRIPDSVPEDFHGHAYLLYSSARRTVVDDGVMLIGDAAGLAYPQSGEGIRPAVESGVLAANAVLAAAGKYGQRELEPYAAALTRRFGARAAPSDAGQRFSLPPGLRQRLGGWLLGSAWFSRRIVLDRWFLHRHEPRLKTES